MTVNLNRYFCVQPTMNLSRYSPCDALKPFVKTFIAIESDNGMQNTVLPDTAIILAFRYRGTINHHTDATAIRLPLSMITGLRHTPRTLRYETNTAALLAVLHEGAAPAFFNIPLHEVFGLSLSLDELLPAPELRALEEQLAEAQHMPGRIALLEAFLISLLQAPAHDPLIAHALQRINQANGNLRISELVSALPISRDPFEKRFRKATGTSPKQFATLIRLRHLINAYTPETRLTDIALTAGYYDQAHFIHDFTTFTGKSPRAFFQSGQYW